MASSPPFKIHDASGEYVASAKTAVLAAVIVAYLGDGARVKFGGKVIWGEVPGDDVSMSDRIFAIRQSSVHYA